MTTAAAGQGRERQRRRTRRAIVAAAAELLAAGGAPSVAEVAQAADVAKRTVYTYFPTVEHLLADAALELTRDRVEPTFGTATDPRERLAAFVRGMVRHSVESEQVGRTIMRLTLDAAPPAEGTPRRGYRRVGWIEQALEPVRDRLAPPAFEQLVSALCTVVGWEPVIVLRDLRGLAPDEIERVCVWTADALLVAALQPGPADAATRHDGPS